MDSDRVAIPGFEPVQRVAQSYLGSLWLVVDQRQGEPGKPVLLRRVQLPADTPRDARQLVALAAREALQLQHPNLLPPIEVIEEGDQLALIHDQTEAEPLRSLQSWANLRGLTFPPGVSLKIVSDLLQGLSALHAVADSTSVSPFGGLSPDSVLVTRAGDACVCDTLVASCAALLEGVGFNTAKLAYAAPEQVHAVAPLTPASDVFACGAMLWELLAARRLLSGSRATIERRLLEHNFPSLAGSLRSDQKVSGGLLELVEHCLAADPEKRPDTPAELLEQLQHCGQEIATQEQVAQFVGKLSGQRLDRRNAAMRSKSLPELEVPGLGSSSGPSSRRAAAAFSSGPAPSADDSEPAASATLTSPLVSPPPAKPPSSTFSMPRPRSAAGLSRTMIGTGSALSPPPPRSERKPAPPGSAAQPEPGRPETSTLGASRPQAAPPPSARKPTPSYIEPPPIPELLQAEDDDESDATIREEAPRDWLRAPPAAPSQPATAASAPSAAPAVPIAPPSAAGRHTVAGVGLPQHPALGATLPFSHLTPDPFPAVPSAEVSSPGAPPVPVVPTAEPSAAPPPASQTYVSPPPTSAGPSNRAPGAGPSERTRSLPAGLPSLNAYEPTLAVVPEQLVPRVSPSARVTRPRSGWERALGRSRRQLSRLLFAGAAVCVALASAIVLVLFLRRPASTELTDGAAAIQGEPAIELPAAAQAEENDAPEPNAARAEDEAAGERAAGADERAQDPADPAGDGAPEATPSSATAAQIDDPLLQQLFALEQYEPWPSCPEHSSSRRARSRKSHARQAREAARLLKAARAALMKGSNDKARSLLCRATAQDPANSQAQQALAELSLRFGNGAQAQSAIQKALAHKPNNSTLLGILGDAMVLAGDLPGSRRVWLRANPSPGSEEEHLRSLAEVYRKLGERLLGRSSYAAACTLFRRALVLGSCGASPHPECKSSYTPSIGLAEALRRLQQPRAALAWAERAANAFPDDARVQLLLGDTLYDNGQKQEAKNAWAAAQEAQPSNALAAQRLAKGKP